MNWFTIKCVMCDETSDHTAGQFVTDDTDRKRWLCSQKCLRAFKSAESEQQSTDDLVASGGIVDAP